MDAAQVGLILSHPQMVGWLKLGVHKRIAMPTRQGHSPVLAGGLNWRTEQVHCRQLQRLDSEPIVAYLEWVLTAIYPHQPMVLVLDKAACHHRAVCGSSNSSLV